MPAEFEEVGVAAERGTVEDGGVDAGDDLLEGVLRGVVSQRACVGSEIRVG